MTFNQRSNGRDQLRQRSTQRDKGQGDDAFGHAQRLGDQRTIINEQICANGDDRRTGDQQDQRLGQGDQLFLFDVFLSGGVLHLPDVGDHVGHEHCQHDKAHRAGKFTEAVGSHAVDGGGDKEEDNWRFQRLGVNLARAHGNRDGCDQRRVADDRTDGIAVGNLAVAGNRRHRGNHDLRQRCADGNDRRANQQLRQVEAAKDAKRKLSKDKKRIAELDTIIKKLYESFAVGRITDERFDSLLADYEAEQKTLQASVAEAEEKLSAFAEDTARVEQFLELARKYTDFSELTTPMINEFIEKITQLVEDNLSSEKIDITYLSDKMCMSGSTLYRKMKALTGLSTNEYIRKVKMQNAERLLLEGKYNISEIAYKIGMNSTGYFRQCFKDEFGVSPSDYLKQFTSPTPPPSS